MSTFKDPTDRVWTIRITIGVVRAIAESTGFDLMPGAEAGKALSKLAYDIESLVNAIYLGCRAEADSRGVDDAAFGELFDGETIDAASEAFINAYTLFCPALIRQGLMKTKAAQDKAETMVMERMDQELTDEQIRKMVDDAMSGAMSSGSPATSGATPTP